MTSNQLSTILNNEIEKLSFQKNIDFGLNICNRLLPDYLEFSKNTNWGNSDKLEKAINFCEMNKSNLEVDKKTLKNLIKEVEINTPDTEDFGDFDGSYALNACTSILDLLEYYQDKVVEHILNISSYIIDKIDIKLGEEDNELTGDELNEHPKIIQELLYQIELTK